MVLSQRHFPKDDFRSENIPSGIVPNLQFPKQQLPKGQVRPPEAQQAAMGPSTATKIGQGAKRFDQNRLGGRALRLGQTWEVAVWKISHLVSCLFGKNTPSKSAPLVKVNSAYMKHKA